MKRPVVDDQLKIQQAKSVAELTLFSQKFCEVARYVTQLYVIYPPIGLETSKSPAIVYNHGTPIEWTEVYFVKKLYKTDTVLRDVFRSHKPILARDIDVSAIPTEEGRNHARTVLAEVSETGLIVPTFGPNNTNGCFFLTTAQGVEITERKMHAAMIYCQSIHLKYCELVRAQRENLCLTARELETMRNVVQGFKTTDIAEIMGVSSHTINTHIRRAFDKMNVTDRVSASMRFIQLGYALE